LDGNRKTEKDVLIQLGRNMTPICLENILFDYGNTLLLDPFVSILRTKANEAIQVIEAEGMKLERKELIRAWIQANNETDYPYISHFYQEEKIIQNLLKELKIPQKSILVNKLLRIYRDGFRESIVTDKESERTRQLLLSLKSMGLRLGVLSNERKRFLKIGLSYLCIDDILDFALSSEELGIEKPKVEFYQTALAMLHLIPEKTLYVGDDPSRDIMPAARAGLKTVLCLQPRKYSTPWRDYDCQKTVKADFTINKLSELHTVLDRISR